MLIERLPEKQIREYSELIGAVGSLSNLFSDSDVPYISYRAAENIFCRCFEADNLSRSDCSVDARLGRTGIGLKTFRKGPASQKIAEFNYGRERYAGTADEEAIRIISLLRNERLRFTYRTYGIDESLYHCLIRTPGTVSVAEYSMLPISIDGIRDIRSKGNIIYFEDGNCEYSFNKSKSTLYTKFHDVDSLLDTEVHIHSDPYALLLALPHIPSSARIPVRESVILPLYSFRGKRKFVHKKSGLNQWNASGRKRSADEVYIPIPAKVHRCNPEFFPERYTEFKLRLPDGITVLSAKVCQDGGKALMTNPNSALGDWILRKVLNLPEGVLLTYEMLENMGINSVVLYKNGPLDYSIDFLNDGVEAGESKISLSEYGGEEIL